MKTTLLKSNFVIALLAVAIGINAQSGSPKKTCIKIQETINGNTIKIDTCFTGLTETEIQKCLTSMGITDIEEMNEPMDSASLVVDKEIDGDDSATSKVIIIHNGKDGDDDHEKVKVVSRKDGKCNVVVIGDDGYSYANSSADNNGSIKTKVVVKTGDGGSDAKTEIFIYRKIEVKDLSDSDNMQIHSGIPTGATPFTGLKIYPNPTESTVTISYNSVSAESLQINVFDENGKIVYTEKVNSPGEHVNKIISLSSLGTGVYFVNLAQGKQSETKKIIVK